MHPVVAYVILISAFTITHAVNLAEPVTEFTAGTFVTILGDSKSGKPASIEYPHVIVDFYAPWCPHCNKFRPIYDSGARYMKAHHPGQVYFGAVDCVAWSSELCQRFNVDSYPTVYFGSPEDFASINNETLIRLPASARLRGRLTDWIETQLQLSLPRAIPVKPNLAVAEKAQIILNEDIDSGLSRFTIVHNRDLRTTTQRMFQYIYSRGDLPPSERPAFEALVTLLADYHPLPRCRRSLQAIVEGLSELWPPDSVLRRGSRLHSTELCLKNADGSRRLSDAKVFRGADASRPFQTERNGSFALRYAEQSIGRGSELPTARHNLAFLNSEGDWAMCRGSSPNTRGFSCGLWLLFHSLSVEIYRTGSNDGLRFWNTMRTYVKNFFACKECSEHFLETTKNQQDQVLTDHDTVLWLWQVHNNVNYRLASEEATEHTGDAAYPKRLFPRSAACPSCRQSVNTKASIARLKLRGPDIGTKPGDIRGMDWGWDREEVFDHLVQFYTPDVPAQYWEG